MSSQLVATPPEINPVDFFEGALREACEKLPPELKSANQHDIEKQRKPTENDFFLRENLWKLIENAQKTGRRVIYSADIYMGICSKQAFHLLLDNPLRLAWLLTRPQENKERLRYGLEIATANLLDFLSKAVHPDTANAWLKGYEMLMNRVHGPVVQRIDSRNVHVKIPAPPKPTGDLNERIEALKAKMEVRDVSEIQAPQGQPEPLQQGKISDDA